MSLTGAHIRMARAALRWRVDHLAEATGLTYARIQQMERTDGVPNVAPDQLEAVHRAFSEAGVVLLDEDDENGLGVRLRKK